MFLGIETSSAVSSVCVSDGDRIIAELTVEVGFTHSEQLVPHIDTLLRYGKVAKDSIEGIAVTIGPGSFTGLRIGMGTAKAMAYAWQVPLVGVMTMDAIAHNFVGTDDLVVVMIDAQKKNVYEGRYEWRDGAMQQIQAPTVKLRADALRDLAALNRPVWLCGDGVLKRREEIEQYPTLHLAPPAMRIPHASSVLAVAKQRFDAKDYDDSMTLVPYYIRRSEAEVLWEAKHPEVAADANRVEPTVVVTEAAGQEGVEAVPTTEDASTASQAKSASQAKDASQEVQR